MTRIAIANCPTAMKSEVEGYMAITLAPTYNGVDIHSRFGSAWTNLGPESKVAKYSDYLVDPNGGANRRAYYDVHAALGIINQLIVYRKKLCHSVNEQAGKMMTPTHILSAGESKHLYRKSRQECRGKVNEVDLPRLRSPL